MMHLITKSKVLVLYPDMTKTQHSLVSFTYDASNNQKQSIGTIPNMTKTQHSLVSFMYDASNNQKQSIGTIPTYDKNTALFGIIHV